MNGSGGSIEVELEELLVGPSNSIGTSSGTSADKDSGGKEVELDEDAG